MKLWYVGFVFALGLSACAPALTWNWSAPGAYKAPPPEKYPKKPAVYLLKERRILAVVRSTSSSYTQWQQHDVLAILNEKGFKHADVRVGLRADAEIINFAARTIGPDGTVTEVQPSSVHDDTARESEKEDQNQKIRVFTFPDVKVGSILEYQYTTQSPVIYTTIREYFVGSLPVEKYILELAGTKDIIYGVKAYNTRTEWAKGESGELWTLTWSMENVPATKKGSYLPDRGFRDPHWLFVVKQFAKYSTQNVNMDWSSAMKSPAERLYYPDEEWHDGFSPDIGDASCSGDGEKSCRMSRAVAWLTKELPFSGFDISTDRKAKDILAQGSAKSYEKARLLHALLKKRGIDARFAYVNRVLGSGEDREMPAGSSFGHIILYVPAQTGVASAMWIDPSCEYCEVGEIPGWYSGVEALVLEADKGFLEKRAEVKASWMKVAGRAPVAEKLERITKVKVDASGAIKVQLEHVASGREAQEMRQDKRTWTDVDYKKNADTIAKERAPTGVSDGYVAMAVDPDVRRARRGINFSAPGFATVDGERLLVPLGFLAKDFEKAFRSKTRKSPIWLHWPTHFEEIAEIEAPEGFVPAKVPAPVVRESACFDVRVEGVIDGSKVRVVRSIRAKPGAYEKDVYAKVREAVQAFVGVKQEVVVFQKRPQ